MKILVKASLWAWSVLYNVKVYGLENLSPQGNLIAAKHAGSPDIAIYANAIPNCEILASKNQAINRLPIIKFLAPGILASAGITQAYTVLGNKDGIISLKEILESGKNIVYAPEGGIEKLAVSDKIFPHPLIRASRQGYSTFVAGTRYLNQSNPWLSFFRWPWQAGVEIRIEPYKPASTIAETASEMKALLGNLSLRK